MRSRERVIRAVRHQAADRVPIDFGGMRSTGIMAIAYNHLKRHLGIATGATRLYDTGQQLAEVEEEVRQRFGADVIDVTWTFPDAPIPNPGWRPWTLPDGSPCLAPDDWRPGPDGEGGWIRRNDDGIVVARMPRDVLYFEGCYHPLENATTLADIDAYEWPVIDDERLEFLHERAKWLSQNTDYAIMASFGGNIHERGQGLRGWDNFLMDVVGDREFADYLMDRMVENHLGNLKRFFAAVGDYIQIVQMGDDLGTQDRPQLRPEIYHEAIHPRHKAIYTWVHEHYPSVAVFLHSCGSIYDLIPDLIDEGVDILNPVQTSAAKMAPVALKANFGDRITFWGGGCDTQRVLPHGTPAEVRQHVAERVAIFKPGGGFVFNQVHNVQANVPPENVVAMFETALETGAY
ncbi:MAG: methyltransferase [Chloroflexi bacterium]|nr:methyltransferase [Chloroflexota bacterium]